MMNHHFNAEKLADFIEAHPNSKFIIDNDSWEIVDKESGQALIEDPDEYWFSGNWYSVSNEYGAGLAEAMLILLNRKGFNLEVEPM